MSRADMRVFVYVKECDCVSRADKGLKFAIRVGMISREGKKGEEGGVT